MNCKFANITKDELEKYVLPFIPKNKRGFSSKVEPIEIMQCIIYKLKTKIILITKYYNSLQANLNKF